MTARVFVGLLVLIGSLPLVASAGSIYKCVDAKGTASYQQQPCAKLTTQVRKDYAPQVPVAKNLGWSAQSGELAGLERQRQSLYEREVPKRAYSQPTVSAHQAAIEPATKRQATARIQNNDLGSTKIDQYGQPFTKVAPNVLIDQKTGKPCITNGNNEIVMCH